MNHPSNGEIPASKTLPALLGKTKEQASRNRMMSVPHWLVLMPGERKHKPKVSVIATPKGSCFERLEVS